MASRIQASTHGAWWSNFILHALGATLGAMSNNHGSEAITNRGPTEERENAKSWTRFYLTRNDTLGHTACETIEANGYHKQL